MAQGHVVTLFQDQQLKEFVRLLVEGELNLQVREANSKSMAFNLSNEGLRVLITDLRLAHGEGTELIDLFSGGRRGIVLISELDPDEDVKKFQGFFREGPNNFVILKNLVNKKLVRILENLKVHLDLGSAAGPVLHDGMELYKIQTEYFLNQKLAGGDVFVRLSSGKFVKIFKKGDEIRPEAIEKFLAKGQNYLYQTKEEYRKHLEEALKGLQQKFKNKDLKTSEKMALQLTSIKQVQNTVRQMGLSDGAIELADEVVTSVEEVLKDARHLQKLVKVLLKKKNHFFTQSSIVNYLLAGLVREIGWDSRITLKKLIFASVFCDFGFDESQSHLALVLSEQDPGYAPLSAKEQELVLQHPLQGAELVKTDNGFLTDEVALIESHHEKPDGSGFPKGLNAKQLPPLSCAFILVYDFTNLLIKTTQNAEDIDPQRVLELMGKNYSLSNFERPYHALKRALKL